MWKENAEDVVTPQTLKRMPQLITKFITGDQQMGASYSVWVLRNNQEKIDSHSVFLVTTAVSSCGTATWN